MTDLMDALNVEGWKAVLFVDGGECAEEAPPGLPADSPLVVRREQWIVAGDQYVFTWLDVHRQWRGPELGEFEHVKGEAPSGAIRAGRNVYSLEELLPLIRRRLEEGEPRESMHPVLLAML